MIYGFLYIFITIIAIIFIVVSIAMTTGSWIDSWRGRKTKYSRKLLSCAIIWTIVTICMGIFLQWSINSMIGALFPYVGL